MDEKRNIQQYLDNLVDFQMAFKMCRKTISPKAKRNEIYSSKQNWAREKHLNKQIVHSLQGLKNVPEEYCMPSYAQIFLVRYWKASQKTYFSAQTCKTMDTCFFIWQRLLIDYSFNFWNMKQKHFHFCRIYIYSLLQIKVFTAE